MKNRSGTNVPRTVPFRPNVPRTREVNVPGAAAACRPPAVEAPEAAAEPDIAGTPDAGRTSAPIATAVNPAVATLARPDSPRKFMLAPSQKLDRSGHYPR